MEVGNKSKTWGVVWIFVNQMQVNQFTCKCQFMHLDNLSYTELSFWFFFSFHFIPWPIQLDHRATTFWGSYQQHVERGISLVTKSRSQYIGLQQGPRNYRWQAPIAKIRNMCSICLECLVLRLYGQCELCITLFRVGSYHELSSQNYKRMNIKLIN